MAEPEFVKCPQCGRVTRTVHPKYPYCPNCNEFLRKHRYCLHYDPITQECTHPEIVRQVEQKDPEARASIADADEIHRCTYHESIIALEPPTRLQAVLGPVFRVGLLTVLAVGAMFWWFHASVKRYQRVAEHRNLEFEVFCPDTVYEGNWFEVQCVVRNRDAREAKTIQLRLNERLLSWFDLSDVSPPPQGMWVAGSARYLQYGNLAGNSEMLIRLRMRGRQVGTYELAVQLIAPGQFQSEIMHFPLDVL